MTSKQTASDSRRWPAALQSRVARRLAMLFIGSALVPMVGLAAVTLYRTNDYLQRESATRLRYDAKTVMMEALGRIELTESTLRVLGTTLTSDGVLSTSDPRLDALFPKRPAVLTFIEPKGHHVDYGKAVTLPAFTDAQQRQIKNHLPLVIAASDKGVGDLLVVPAADSPALTIASLDYAQIFGLDDLDPLPPDAELCVHQQGRLLVCSSGAQGRIATAATAITEDQEAELVSDDGDRFLARARSIPLQVAYGSEPWTMVLMRPRSVTAQPTRAFVGDFWKVAIGTLLLVSLLALSQVRRQLQPLNALMEGTRRLGQRQFRTPVRISSGDEFESLGDAFNTLSRDLARQFDELEAFGLGTLETLARTIDAKSSWTAGHSSRVTALAVKIAVEMKLPSQEIEQLRRGGLVHDIGKLATPPHILDKPARLNDDELAIMRQHPMQGVHILEPIASFKPLLPIVAQHHERWDGKGYPAGLAGKQIARTARVLAVADVFDAIRADRPYRTGMPFSRVVAIIETDSGTHFDPDVVAAFLRLARGHQLGEELLAKTA